MIRLLLRTAAHRLARDRSFMLSALLSLSVAGVMSALAAAWLWGQLTVQPPYRSIDSLWFVQLTSFNDSLDGYGSEMQASITALGRLVERESLFDELVLAKSASTIVLSINGADSLLSGTRVRTLVHQPNLHAVLGTDVSSGTFPRADRYEVAISHAFASRYFDSPKDAIGNTIETSETPLTVTGVLHRNFVAPSLLGQQRSPYGAIGLYRPTTQLLQTSANRDDQDHAEPWLVVGRSERSQEIIQRHLETLVSEIAAEMGRWNLGVTVRPLRAHMLGSAPATGLVLLIATLVLASSTIFGIMLLSAARFAARAPNADALRSSGAGPNAEWAFERYEAIMIAGLSGVAGLALVFLMLPLINLTFVARGIVDSLFVLRSSSTIIAWSSLVALLLVAVAATVSPSENLWMRRLQLVLGLSRKGLHGPLQRILQGLQVLIALAAMTSLLTMLDTARSTLAAAAGLDYSGTVQWELEYPPGTGADVMREDLERIRSTAQSHPQVQTATVSLASALDLLSDYSFIYSGPRMTGDETLLDTNHDGSYILKSSGEGETSAESSMLRYSIFIAPVGPEFFRILGYRTTQGRTFDGGDTDVAVLTPAASRVLYESAAGVVDELVPASPRIEDRQGVASMWHGGVRVIGEVEDRRIHRGLPGIKPLLQSPVVFVPYTGPKISSNSPGTSRGFVLLDISSEHDAPNRLLESHLQNSLVPGLQGKVTVLEKEKNQRLRQHLIGSLGVLAICILVISSAALSSWGSGRLSAYGRRQEIAIRLALGADESQVIRRVLVHELTGALILTVVWISLITIIDSLGRAIGLSEFVSLGDSLAASGIVLVSVALGALIGVREPVLKPPMNVLRAE